MYTLSLFYVHTRDKIRSRILQHVHAEIDFLFLLHMFE